MVSTIDNPENENENGPIVITWPMDWIAHVYDMQIWQNDLI